MGWGSDPVHDGIDQCLELLDPSLRKILMLVMWFTLPVIDAVCVQDFLDLVADLHLGVIANKLSRGSPCLDLVFQSIDELPISFNGIYISDEGFNADKDLSDGGTRVNRWGVGIDGICCNRLIPPVDIQSGKWRFIPLFEEGGH